MHPTVPNQSHDSIGDDYAGHGEELGCASRPDGPPGQVRSRKCGPLGAATIGRSCPCQLKNTAAHAETCERMAESLGENHFGLRETMRDVAAQWRRLAADADAEARGANPLT
jgi:hypothetical protein